MVEFIKNLFSPKVHVEWTVPIDSEYEDIMNLLGYFNGSLDDHIVTGDGLVLFISYPGRKELNYKIMCEHLENYRYTSEEEQL